MNEVMKIVSYLFSLTFLRYLFIAGGAFLLFYYLLANKLTNAKIQSRSLKKKNAIRELLHSSQSAFIFALITFFILFTSLKNYTWIYDDVNDYPLWWIVVSTLLSLVIHDTYFYWMHRLLHHKLVYKHTHVVHHKSTNPSPWASYSFHILEAIAEGLILLVIVFILPMHITAISLFTVLGLIINVYGHLGYEIAPEAFRRTLLFQLLNTSVHHNMHHSRFNGNYGLYFRIWDKLMKTELQDYEDEYDKIQKRRFNK